MLKPAQKEAYLPLLEGRTQRRKRRRRRGEVFGFCKTRVFSLLLLFLIILIRKREWGGSRRLGRRGIKIILMLMEGGKNARRKEKE